MEDRFFSCLFFFPSSLIVPGRGDPCLSKRRLKLWKPNIGDEMPFDVKWGWNGLCGGVGYDVGWRKEGGCRSRRRIDA